MQPLSQTVTACGCERNWADMCKCMCRHVHENWWADGGCDWTEQSTLDGCAARGSVVQITGSWAQLKGLLPRVSLVQLVFKCGTQPKCLGRSSVSPPWVHHTGTGRVTGANARAHHSWGMCGRMCVIPSKRPGAQWDALAAVQCTCQSERMHRIGMES